MAIIDKNFEDKVLAALIRSNEFAAVASPHLRPAYFDGPMSHNLAKIAADYFLKYGSVVSPLAMIDGIKELEAKKVVSTKELPVYAEEIKRLKSVDLKDQPYVLEKLIDFVKEREYRKAIENAVTKGLPKGDFKSIEQEFARIASISTSIDRGSSGYWGEKNIEGRTKRREEELELALKGGIVGVSTGIKRLDDVFPKGGFYRKELYVIMAPPKAGKTMALSWFANAASMQGKTVAYFSCEVSREILEDRLDALNSEVKIRELGAHIPKVHKALEGKRPKGEIYIFEYPTKTLTAREIERQLRKLQVQQGVVVDMVIVDYGDIMKPNVSYRDDVLREQASIFEDLRTIAGNWNCPVITATQVNRTGSKKALIRGEDVAGTWEKIMVADYIISLSSDEDERKKGEIKIHFAQCRNVESRTLKIKTAYGFGKFYEKFVEEVL